MTRPLPLFRLAAALALLATPVAADPLAVESHYSPAENLEKIDVAQIRAATRSIDIAAYVLTDVAVIEALTQAAGRGVNVRLFRDSSGRELFGRPLEALQKLAATPNVAVRFNTGRALMHLKSYCVDGQTLRTGAANFSASGLKQQDNDLTLLRGPAACAAFDANFKMIWGAQ